MLAATAYDCPTDGETYLLIFNECLFFAERFSVSLLCPNQLSAFGLSVCDTPQQFDADSPYNSYLLPGCNVANLSGDGGCGLVFYFEKTDRQ